MNQQRLPAQGQTSDSNLQPNCAGEKRQPDYGAMLADRMAPSEAMVAVTRMLTAYSDGVTDRDYMMNLAQVLTQFPRTVATAASSPVHGVPKQYRDYRPNAGQVTAWCEKEAAFYRRLAQPRALPAPPIDREGRLSLDELRARYGPDWGLNGGRKRLSPVQEAQAILDRHAADAQCDTAKETAE